MEQKESNKTEKQYLCHMHSNYLNLYLSPFGCFLPPTTVSCVVGDGGGMRRSRHVRGVRFKICYSSRDRWIVGQTGRNVTKTIFFIWRERQNEAG
eukprot:1036089-Amorphochlora_amoeboformis.AAC.1